MHRMRERAEKEMCLEFDGGDGAGVEDDREVGFTDTIRGCWPGKNQLCCGFLFLCLERETNLQSHISLWYIACSK